METGSSLLFKKKDSKTYTHFLFRPPFPKNTIWTLSCQCSDFKFSFLQTEIAPAKTNNTARLPDLCFYSPSEETMLSLFNQSPSHCAIVCHLCILCTVTGFHFLISERSLKCNLNAHSFLVFKKWRTFLQAAAGHQRPIYEVQLSQAKDASNSSQQKADCSLVKAKKRAAFHR